MAESQGLPAGNDFYPFSSTVHAIIGCHFYGDISDTTRANTAFFGRWFDDDDPLEIFQIPAGAANRFFCNVTDAVSDVETISNFAANNSLLPP